jgi:hypothetical protein
MNVSKNRLQQSWSVIFFFQINLFTILFNDFSLPPLEPVMMHGSTLVTRGGSPIGNDGGSNIVIRQFERQVD